MARKDYCHYKKKNELEHIIFYICCSYFNNRFDIGYCFSIPSMIFLSIIITLSLFHVERKSPEHTISVDWSPKL